MSKNPYVKLEYSLENTFLRGFNLAYLFRYNDVNYYRKGRKTNNVTYRYYMGELGLSSLYLRNFKFKVGLRYEYFDYNSLLFSNEDEVMSVRPEGFFSYYGVAELDTYDRRFYPTGASPCRPPTRCTRTTWPRTTGDRPSPPSRFASARCFPFPTA